MGDQRASVVGTAGFLIGMGAMALLMTQGGLGHRRRPDPERMLKKFTREFDLTPQQQASVRSVLEEKAKKLDAIHAETEAKLAEIRASTRAQLRALLSPEQQAKFDEKAKRWDARRKADALKEGGSQ